MPRPPRITPAGYVYHVINRGFLRSEIFSDEEDYSCFIKLLSKFQKKYTMKICAFCLMPNHWHIALWPDEDDVISRFMQQLSSSHVSAWRKRWGTSGHLYQGRYRCFPVQQNSYFANLVQYIEENPVRAGLVNTPAEWRWSSAALRQGLAITDNVPVHSSLTALLTNKPAAQYSKLPVKLVEEIRNSIKRGSPLGKKDWIGATAKKLALESTINQHGGKREEIGKTGQGA